jgi:hypothetical protein
MTQAAPGAGKPLFQKLEFPVSTHSQEEEGQNWSQPGNLTDDLDKFLHFHFPGDECRRKSWERSA